MKKNIDEENKNKGYASIEKPWQKYYSKEVLEKEMPKMNICDYLYKNNYNHLDRIALNYFGRKTTYRELFANIEKIASSFIHAGIKKGDIVTVSLPMVPENIFIFYALAKIGAISNMIDPRTNENGTKEYLNEVNSKMLIVFDDMYQNVENLINDSNLEKVLVVNSTDSLPIGMKIIASLKPKKADYKNEKVISWKNFLKLGTYYPLNIESVYEKDNPVCIVHTGGTTGFPKGVMLTNDNYNALVEQFRYTGLDFKREHTWLGMIPLFFAYGGGIGLHHPLSVGMELKVIPMFNPEKMDDLILKYKANHMAIIPSYFESIIRSKKTQNVDFSFMVMPACGSDKLNVKFEKEINEFLAKHNCKNKVVKGYGMSEVASGICVTGKEETNIPGSVGIPFPSSTIAIFNPNTDEELTYENIGEICMTGPNVMLGYYNNSEETNKILKKHRDEQIWVHSGDLGYMKPDGVLFVVGRMKRLVTKYGGFKIFPPQIESIISELPMIENVCVIPIIDKNHPEFSLLKAHIVIKLKYKELEEQILEEIKKACVIKLPEYAIPDEFIIRESLPLTQAGKIDFKTLEAEEIKINQGISLERIRKL